jgi:Phage P22-like portal protein
MGLSVISNTTLTPKERKLKKLKDRYDYGLRRWQDTREDSKKDRRYLAGDPWDPKEKQARKDEGRPAMVLDELNQWLNKLTNNVRMNKRGIAVSPRYDNDKANKEAEVRQGIIRDIEYVSNAQAAYITALEGAGGSSMGFFRITTEYEPKSFNQRLRIKQIDNPDSVVMDPDYSEADASDMCWCYVVSQMTKEDFRAEYPKAQIHDFTSEMMADAPQWIREDDVTVAEYWEVVKTKRTLLMLHEPDTGVTASVYEDELPEGITYKALKAGGHILKEREEEDRQVMQTITNGIEILKETPWAGQWIPIVPVLGKTMWVDFGKGAQRVILSLIRLARDPYMLYCYLRSNEMEEAGMTPKTPFIAYTGQFAGKEADWQDVNKQPKAYLEANAKTEATGDAVLPLPERQPFQPNFQSYEIAAEAMRRAIQAAVGVNALPTAAQRQNEKSGVALERISQQEDLGSFHFIDNLDRALEFAGRQLDDLMDHIYDTKRTVGTRAMDDKYKPITLNDPDDPESVTITSGLPHQVAITVGPSDNSQREAAGDFAELLAKIPGVFPRIADLIVRLKQLGPIGEQIADRLTPPEFAAKDGKPLPPQAIAIINKLQQSSQALNVYAQQLEGKIKQLEFEKSARVTDNQSKERQTALQEETKLTIAELKVQADAAQSMMKGELDQIQQMLQLVHERLQQNEKLASDMQAAQLAAQASQQPPAEPAAAAQPQSA